MTVKLKKSISARATPITVVDRAALKQLLPTLPPATRQWLQTTGFTAAPDSHALVADAQGQLARVLPVWPQQTIRLRCRRCQTLCRRAVIAWPRMVC